MPLHNLKRYLIIILHFKILILVRRILIFDVLESNQVLHGVYRYLKLIFYLSIQVQRATQRFLMLWFFISRLCITLQVGAFVLQFVLRSINLHGLEISLLPYWRVNEICSFVINLFLLAKYGPWFYFLCLFAFEWAEIAQGVSFRFYLEFLIQDVIVANVKLILILLCLYNSYLVIVVFRLDDMNISHILCSTLQTILFTYSALTVHIFVKCSLGTLWWPPRKWRLWFHTAKWRFRILIVIICILWRIHFIRC